ncbi:MAG: HEAT repeat domain-containing protein [Nitrospirae bacterium]|nr:MAG: HEAT repeat domain-containing protein [Nitrospirota bacterium]
MGDVSFADLSEKLSLIVLCGVLVLLWWGGNEKAYGAAQIHVVSQARGLSGTKTIAVQVEARTWKPRGRLLYDIEGSVRVKLADAGFHVVRTAREPHGLTLTVLYQETKGEPYGINQFGTVITGTFRLAHHMRGTLLELTVQETAKPSISGPPPYLDALQNFQTNPYYYFLGDILWGHVNKQWDVTTVFLHALRKSSQRKAQEIEDPDLSRFTRPDHTMISPHEVFAPIAIKHTIQELVKLQESRVIPLLYALLKYPNVYVQVACIEGFGALQLVDALPVLYELREHASSIEVRHAAQVVSETLQDLLPSSFLLLHHLFS